MSSSFREATKTSHAVKTHIVRIDRIDKLRCLRKQKKLESQYKKAGYVLVHLDIHFVHFVLVPSEFLPRPCPDSSCSLEAQSFGHGPVLKIPKLGQKLCKLWKRLEKHQEQLKFSQPKYLQTKPHFARQSMSCGGESDDKQGARLSLEHQEPCVQGHIPKSSASTVKRDEHQIRTIRNCTVNPSRNQHKLAAMVQFLSETPSCQVFPGTSAAEASSYKATFHLIKFIDVEYVYMYVCTCMYVCMCTCMYVCMCTCMYVYMYVCVHVCMYVYMYVYMYVCMYVYMYVCMYVYMYVCVHVCMCTCMYVYMYVCVHVCMYVCTYSKLYEMRLPTEPNSWSHLISS